MRTSNGEQVDVLVVGGGAAGLSAALVLARSRRSLLVIDAGEPRNAPAAHAHNFLTRDGVAPADLYAAGRAEVERYGGRVETGTVLSIGHENGDPEDGEHSPHGHPQDPHFSVEFADRTVQARRLVVATGLRDQLPDVPGLVDRWGRDVLHCPYCHGWEVRDQRIGVLNTGPMAMHQALLFRQLSADVTMLQHTGGTLDADQREQLEALGIPLVEGIVTRVNTADDRLCGVAVGEHNIALDALVVGPRPAARAELLLALGLRPVDVVIGNEVIGTRIESDPTGATSVPGVWVAGNITDPMAQVVTSAAQGVAAGAAVNADLAAADARRAVEELRGTRAPALAQPNA